MKEEDVKIMSDKMEKMDELLNQNLFSNPVKEVQKKMQHDLLELNEQMSKNNLGNGKNNIQVANEEMDDLKTALEHKKYQVEILKREFGNYEKKSEDEIQNLKIENDKLKYRIKMLLNTINELENKK